MCMQCTHAHTHTYGSYCVYVNEVGAIRNSEIFTPLTIKTDNIMAVLVK